MEEPFSLHATLDAVGQAMAGIFCHMFFLSALHGMALSLILALIGFGLWQQKHRFGSPLLSVSRRFALLCLIVMLPGVVSLLATGKLPPAGVFNVNSIGFIVFWGMVLTHMIGEEMNHAWFAAKKKRAEASAASATPSPSNSVAQPVHENATAKADQESLQHKISV